MSRVSGDSQLLPVVVRIRMNPPPPEQWTLVSEYNVEKKDTYQDWKYGVNRQLQSIRQQLMTCSEIIDIMNEEIEEEKKLLLELTTPKETTPTISSNDTNSSD